MIGTLILIVICLVILFILWHLLKNITKIVINSILGLLLIIIVNALNIFPLLGYPDLEVGLVAIVACALAGIPGAILVMLLHLLGFL